VKREIAVYPDLAAASAAVAAIVVDLARDGPERPSLAISGGSTPSTLFGLLAGATATTPRLRELEVFFSDERAVPPDDPASNFALARRLWFAPAKYPPERIHRICGEVQPVDAAADRYDAELRGFFGGPPSPDRTGFDLALLGVGPDGHTASLFPGVSPRGGPDRWAVATPPGRVPPPLSRVTLTQAALATARTVVFLVAGAEKRAIVRRLLAPPAPGEEPLPAAEVRPRERLLWVLDVDAAGEVGDAPS